MEFMESHISAAEAARNFPDMIERVRSRGEVFVVEREGEAICRIAPLAPRRTVQDLMRLLQSAPRPDDAYFDAVEDIARGQPPLSEEPHWER